MLLRADGAGEAELRGVLRADVGGVFAQAPRDVLSLSSPQEGWTAYHDGTGGNTAGPCYYNGANWISHVDQSTIS